MEVCLVCGYEDGPLTLLTTRGVKSIKEFAKLQNDTNVLSKMNDDSQFYIHKSCQKDFTNKRRISQQKNRKTSESTHTQTRSKTIDFSWKRCCFFCDQKFTNKKNVWADVTTLGFRDKILLNCHSRLLLCSDDAWALSVKSKLSTCFDLVAEGASYHKFCRLSFLKGHELKSSIPKGRPKEKDKSSSFERACDWLEKEIELHTLSEFAEKATELSESHETYSNVHLMQLLEEIWRVHNGFTSRTPKGLHYHIQEQC